MIYRLTLKNCCINSSVHLWGAEGDPPKKSYDPSTDPGYVGDENTAYVYAKRPEGSMNPMNIGTNANDVKIYGLLHRIAQKLDEFESNLYGNAEQAWGKHWYSKGTGGGSTATKTKIGFDPETIEGVDEMLEMFDLISKQLSKQPGKLLTDRKEVIEEKMKEARAIKDLIKKGKLDQKSAKIVFKKVKDVDKAIKGVREMMVDEFAKNYKQADPTNASSNQVLNNDSRLDGWIESKSIKGIIKRLQSPDNDSAIHIFRGDTTLFVGSEKGKAKADW